MKITETLTITTHSSRCQEPGMKIIVQLILLLVCLQGLPTIGHGSPDQGSVKKRIMVISSYHREYLWSQDTNKGVVSALQDFGFIDNEAQADEYTNRDSTESSQTLIKKLWLDTKRKDSQSDILGNLAATFAEIEAFAPDVILLGDDNAVNYVGNQYVDSEIPIVFWGVNGHPLKYSFFDSLEKPGRNITGVYQAGYLKECLIYLKKLVPDIKSFAILSDASPSGRAKAKELLNLSAKGELSIPLAETVITDSYREWQAKALELQHKVDAFFVLNHNTLKDDQGNSIDQMQAGAWYLRNIKKPDTGHERQFVVEGILCCIDDSGFKQGYEAVRLVNRILNGKENPAEISIYAPDQGPFIVNRERAEMLNMGLATEKSPFVEEYISSALALKRYPE